MDRDGTLWVAGRGLAGIDSDRNTTNEFTPPALVRSIVTEDGSFEPVDQVRLPNRTATLCNDYTALSLSTPGRVRFRYCLEGYDEAVDRRRHAANGVLPTPQEEYSFTIRRASAA